MTSTFASTLPTYSHSVLKPMSDSSGSCESNEEKAVMKHVLTLSYYLWNASRFRNDASPTSFTMLLPATLPPQ